MYNPNWKEIVEKIKDPSKHVQVKKEIETFLQSLIYNMEPKEAFHTFRNSVKDDLGTKDIAILKTFLIRCCDVHKFASYVFDVALSEYK